MRSIIGFSVFFLLVNSAYSDESLTGENQAETVSGPCAKVTCANHGVCVMKRGEPVCACDEGYEADPTTGLSCRPIRQTKPRFRRRFIPVTIDDTGLTPQRRVEARLHVDRGHLDAEYERFLEADTGTSFGTYMFRKFTKRRGIGIGILVPGLVGNLAAIGMLQASAPEEDASGNDLPRTSKERAWLGAGISTLIVGVAMTIAGSVLVDQGRRGRNRLKDLMLEDRYSTTNGSRITFSGLISIHSPDGRTNGMALNFRF